MDNIVTAKEITENKKLGVMSTTYAAKQSCPKACPFKESGACYGSSGPISFHWGKLTRNAEAQESSVKAIAKAEAKAIDGLSGKFDLRLHTLGDCQTDEAAKVVSAACERYMARGKKVAYSYTHAWRTVSRESWGKVSILASCETSKDVQAAKDRGYATAMVVQSFQKDTAYEQDGMKMVPCPEQTGRAKSCDECRLCLNAEKLKTAGITIAFAAHGPTKKMKAVLDQKATAK